MKKIKTTIDKAESIRRVKTINKDLVINGGDLDVYLELLIDGEKILEKKGDSYVANYIVALLLLMGSGSADLPTIYRERGNGVASITGISSGAGGVIRLTFTSGIATTGAGKVIVSGVAGITIDGIYDYNYISTTTIDLVGTTYGAGWTSNTGCAMLYNPAATLSAQQYTLRTPALYIGAGTTATTINDFSLELPIPNRTTLGGLTYNVTTLVSEDTADATSAQVTITRTFVNQSGNTVTINEAGLAACIGNDDVSQRALLMRDIISGGVAVANGKTLTVNYRLKTQLSTGTNPGGFVHNFSKFMYRQLNNTPRPIIAINNVSYAIGGDPTNMQTISAGGKNVLNFISGSNPAYQRGIVIGTGTTSTSMTDYYLETVVEHGTGPNQMLYYGGFVEGFVIGADYAQFTIYKVFENISGSSIIINEIGLTGSCYGAGSPYYVSERDALIARNILTSPVTVANNEILKVAYTIKVVV